jgi:hypothetical protein
MSSSPPAPPEPPPGRGAGGLGVRGRVKVGRVGRGRAFFALPKENDVGRLDLGRFPLVPLFVLPFPGPQLPLDKDLLPLGEVLLAEFGQLAPDDDLVPLGLVFGLPSIGIEGPFVRGQGEVGFPPVLLREAEHLGLAAQPADEDDFVQAVDVSHFSVSSLIFS